MVSRSAQLDPGGMMSRRGWWRLAQGVIGAVIVVIAMRQLIHNWDELQRQPLEWRIRPAYIVAAVALTWAMYALLVQAWRAVLRSWGAPLDPWSAAARIWIVSGLGKYLPGKVWAITGMALMAQRAGVPPWIATGTSVLLQALSIAAGGAVVGLTGLTALEGQYPWVRPALLVIAGLSAVGVALLLWRPFTYRVLRAVGVAPEYASGPSPGMLLMALVANMVAWVGYGASLWLLSRGLLSSPGLDLRTATGAFTASYLAGFLVLVAPGGLGVREGTLFLMLQGSVGPAVATALALASRIMLTFTEFGGAVPFIVRPGDSRRVVNSRTGSSAN